MESLANQIEDRAVSGTLKGVFQSPDSSVANALLKARDMGPLSKPLQLIFPFVRTPIQIAERGLEFFPPYQALRIGLKSTERGPLSKIGSKGEYMDELAKLTVGLGLSAFAVNLVQRGVLTGGRLHVSDEQRRLEAATTKQYTVNLGGKAYEFGRLDPVAFPLALMANLAEIFADDSSLVAPEEIAYGFVKSSGTIFKDKLYIKQISDIVELFSSTDDEEKLARSWSKFMVNLGSQAVPYGSLVSRIGRADDAQRFRATTTGLLGGGHGAFQRRYGLGNEKTLFGYYDVLGQKVMDVLESDGDLGRKILQLCRAVSDHGATEQADHRRARKTADFGKHFRTAA